MAKEASTIGGLMDTIATLVSVSLQYGVPVESLVRKFEHVRFEPSGMTRNQDIPMAKSLVDYIFRWLAMEFVPGYKAANAPKRAAKPTVSPQAKPTASAVGHPSIMREVSPTSDPLPPSPGTPGEARDEGDSSSPSDSNPKKSGNGHHPRLPSDPNTGFDYEA